MFCNTEAIKALERAVVHLAHHLAELEMILTYDFAKLDAASAAIVQTMEKSLADFAAKVADLTAQLAKPPVPVDDPAVQAHIDSVAAALQAEVDKVAPPPAPEPAPAPAPEPAPEAPPAA